MSPAEEHENVMTYKEEYMGGIDIYEVILNYKVEYIA